MLLKEIEKLAGGKDLKRKRINSVLDMLSLRYLTGGWKLETEARIVKRYIWK